MNIGSGYNTTASNDIGGRVFLLFLLFGIGMYSLANIGLSGLAIIALIPAIVIISYLTFKYDMFSFWTLFAVNYLIMFYTRHYSFPLPVSITTEIFEIIFQF